MSDDVAAAEPFLSGTGRNASLARAFEVLEALAAQPGGASVATVAKATDLPRSTVSRVLASLFDVGAVARPGSQRNWVLGPTIARLSRSVHDTNVIARLARPVLLDLTAFFREASMILVPVGTTSARALDHVPCPRIVGAMPTWSEPIFTSPASGAVRMLLAELDPEVLRPTIEQMSREQLAPATKTGVDELVRAVEEVRVTGHSIVVDEVEEGLAGVGVAVRNGEGGIVALLSVYLPTARLAAALNRGLIEHLHRMAQRLREEACDAE